MGRHEGGPKVNELVDKQIKATVDAELAKKGLTRTDADTADLYWVSGRHRSGKTLRRITTDGATGPDGMAAAGYGAGGGMTTGQTSTIYVGQLALDFYTPASTSLVWRGAASKTIDEERSRRNSRRT